MTDSLMHPGLILVVAGLLIAWLPQAARSTLTLLAPLFALVTVWQLPEGTWWHFAYLDVELTIIRSDPLSRLFSIIFCIMAFAGGMFALNQPSKIEVPAAFVYAGAAVGAALAGDLVTLFVWWEFMALASAMIIWSTRNRTSYRASFRYIIIHLGGGVLLMAGIAGHYALTGSIAFDAMATDSLAHWLILAGFLVNAGAPPLSAWLPDAYPEASFSGTVFLSAFTTKTAVYVLLRGFPGTELLIYVGLFMIFYGIIYALLENDMRRILVYSIVNQVGFMVVGAGIGTDMAINGAASHAFAHIIYKALLLMSAGSVLLMTGRRKCSELGGLFQSMPLTTICGTIGAMAISAFPLTSGFVTKSMVTQAAADQHFLWVWLLLGAASAGVFLHAGIKFPWFVFFQKDSGLRPPDPPWNMRIAMVLFAFLCIALGVYPAPLYALLPYPVEFVAYTGPHVVVQLQLLLFSGLAFFVMLPWLKRTNTITLDFDWIYRVGIPGIVSWVSGHITDPLARSNRRFMRLFEVTLSRIYRHYGPEGILARTWPTGSMVLWVAILLASYLVIYYL